MVVSVVAPTTLVKQNSCPTLSEKTEALAIGARFSIDRHMIASANWMPESAFSWAAEFHGIKIKRKSMPAKSMAVGLIGFIFTSPDQNISCQNCTRSDFKILSNTQLQRCGPP